MQFLARLVALRAKKAALALHHGPGIPARLGL